MDRHRYREARLYAAEDINAWRVSFDAISHYYDLAFNGLRDVYQLNETLRYAIGDSLTSNVSLDQSRAPDFPRNTTELLNLVYNFKRGS